MRPLFLAQEDAPEAWDHRQYSYLLGSELLVAPVIKPGENSRTLWLPEGNWVHLWSGESFGGGFATVDAPMGKPPVFYMAGSPWAALFRDLAQRLSVL